MPGHGPSTKFSVGDFTVDRVDERLIGPLGPVKLGNKAFRVLCALIDQQGTLITKDALFTSVWDGTIVSESALTSVIKELRRALGDGSKQPRYIESVYGRGYRLIAMVNVVGDSPPAVPAAPKERRPQPLHSTRSMKDEPPTVVVSAFLDEPVRSTHPYLGAALREEVISSLAQFREIQLLASLEADERNISVADPHRSYQLSATLLPDGDSVKVIARTRRMSDGRVLWADTMSLADTGTAGGVDRIIKRIAGSILPAVDQGMIVGISQVGDRLFDRYLVAKRSTQAVQDAATAYEAAKELEQIIAERPDFALAYGPLVRLYNTDFFFTAFGRSDRQLRARALELARTAVTVDPSHGYGYTTLGFSWLYNGEYQRARECLEQAYDRNPYNPERLNEIATGLTYLGDFAQSRRHLATCRDLQPWSETDVMEEEGRLHLLEGDLDQAKRALSSIIRPSVFSELYLGLTELALERPSGQTRLNRWRSLIETRWHDGTMPDAQMIIDRISWHHPFQGDYGKPLFDLVNRAFLKS